MNGSKSNARPCSKIAASPLPMMRTTRLRRSQRRSKSSTRIIFPPPSPLLWSRSLSFSMRVCMWPISLWSLCFRQSCTKPSWTNQAYQQSKWSIQCLSYRLLWTRLLKGAWSWVISWSSMSRLSVALMALPIWCWWSLCWIMAVDLKRLSQPSRTTKGCTSRTKTRNIILPETRMAVMRRRCQTTAMCGFFVWPCSFRSCF